MSVEKIKKISDQDNKDLIEMAKTIENELNQTECEAKLLIHKENE